MKWSTIVDMVLDTLKTMCIFFLLKNAVAASPIEIPGIFPIIKTA